MREFGWRQMSIIAQDDHLLFSRVTDELASVIFKNEGWILDRYDVLSGHNPLPFFDRSEAQKFRIIHINAYPDIAYPVLCEAYYRGMFGSKYLWILPLWYNAGWWRSNSPSSSNNESCTDEIMIQVIDGSLGLVPDGYLTLQNKSIVTFSGLTSVVYLSNYTDLLTNEP
ncbi:PREDICTED: gamma-aminobutyric acid type B receptor subunit 2-like, partial [Amphimedon queenslandica]|uniref:Receptor ligand binding region domain-containing protein n=1 Tax=Amphimedon queenslandica TaxID=400682 RepID=A0AAN0JYD9_AMPQE